LVHNNTCGQGSVDLGVITEEADVGQENNVTIIGEPCSCASNVEAHHFLRELCAVRVVKVSTMSERWRRTTAAEAAIEGCIQLPLQVLEGAGGGYGTVEGQVTVRAAAANLTGVAVDDIVVTEAAYVFVIDCEAARLVWMCQSGTMWLPAVLPSVDPPPSSSFASLSDVCA
jgi:hypothetical protein